MSELSANAGFDVNPDPIEHGHFDATANKLGFWLFLFTEVLLFGMLFLAFAVYLAKFTAAFRASSAHLDVVMGGTNTLVLLTSSLTMALAIRSVQCGKKGMSLFLMFLTIAFAATFCVIKYFEWTHKIHNGIFLTSPVLADMSRGEQLFYGLYYTMTGFHALHVVVGSILIILAMIFVAKGKVHKDRLSFIENAGLFWHLVDLVWIYLFPLFYLIR